MIESGVGRIFAKNGQRDAAEAQTTLSTFCENPPDPNFSPNTMTRTLAVLLLAVSILASLAAQVDDTANAPRIPIVEFRQLMTSGKVIVVDVRDAQSYVTGHIPGARSAPLDTLLAPKTVDALKTAGGLPIVLYCA